jgi:hypothetical protein
MDEAQYSKKLINDPIIQQSQCVSLSVCDGGGHYTEDKATVNREKERRTGK